MPNVLVPINEGLVYALDRRDQARLLLLSEDTQNYSQSQQHELVFIDMAELTSYHNEMDSQATTIRHAIHKMRHTTNKIQESMQTHRGKTLIVCQGRDDQATVEESALLIGAFAILVEDWNLDAVVQAFPDIAHRLMPAPGLALDRSKYSVTVLDCWQALLHARERSWMSWRTSPDDDDLPLLVEEMAHYAHPANGGIHILAPALLLFPSPVDLPDGELWAGAPARDGAPPVRRFAAAFYADLLPDLGVGAVASLEPCRCAAAPAAFAAASLPAVDLAPAAGARRGPPVLHALDALLSLTRAAGGGVALHAGGNGAPGAWPAHAAVVVAAYLVGREGFSERAAYGWLLLLCPWLLAAPSPPPVTRGAED